MPACFLNEVKLAKKEILVLGSCKERQLSF